MADTETVIYLKSDEHDDIGLALLGFVGLNARIDQRNEFIKDSLCTKHISSTEGRRLDEVDRHLLNEVFPVRLLGFVTGILL